MRVSPRDNLLVSIACLLASSQGRQVLKNIQGKGGIYSSVAGTILVALILGFTGIAFWSLGNALWKLFVRSN